MSPNTPKNIRKIGWCAVTVLAFALVASATTAASAGSDPGSAGTGGNTAVFGSEAIDISEDWGDATACLVWPDQLDVPECFATEAELAQRVASIEAEQAAGFQHGASAASGANCSGYLKLYDGTSYTGSALWLRGRLQWFNLASFNFDQKTSSFKIGPCSAYFADLASGGGSWYPTSDTEAYDVASTMLSGWDNDVSSVYIT
ncbi:MAG: hypothetical protein OXH78_09460 [Acidimicrobiaceae bacterium]|nr:hypothetical protein [Acidimicrobiaceae bacterium]